MLLAKELFIINEQYSRVSRSCYLSTLYSFRSQNKTGRCLFCLENSHDEIERIRPMYSLIHIHVYGLGSGLFLKKEGEKTRVANFKYSKKCI